MASPTHLTNTISPNELQVCFWVVVTIVTSVVATFIQAGLEFPFIPFLERIHWIEAVALSHASALIHTNSFDCVVVCGYGCISLLLYLVLYGAKSEFAGALHILRAYKMPCYNFIRQ